MAKRTLNRRELRKQSDAAEQQAEKPATEAKAAPRKKRASAKTADTATKVRRPRKKKEPTRMCARWGVFDAGMKQLAVFDYNQRKEADQKVVDLSAKKSGTFFVQMIKEPMPEPELVEAASTE